MKFFVLFFQFSLSQEMSLLENQEMLPCPTKNDPNLMCTGWNLKFPGLILCAFIPETVYFSTKSNFHLNQGRDFQPGFNCMNVSYCWNLLNIKYFFRRALFDILSTKDSSFSLKEKQATNASKKNWRAVEAGRFVKKSLKERKWRRNARSTEITIRSRISTILLLTSPKKTF